MSLGLYCVSVHQPKQRRTVPLTHWPLRNVKGISKQFKLILWINIFSIFYEIGLMWVPQNPTDDKSTLVQVMVLCRQATSYYLDQCWPRIMSPFRPQWVNSSSSSAPYMRRWIRSALIKVTAWCQAGANFLSIGPLGTKFGDIWKNRTDGQNKTF